MLEHVSLGLKSVAESFPTFCQRLFYDILRFETLPPFSLPGAALTEWQGLEITLA